MLNGQAIANPQRERALERYYSNPSKCKWCGEVIRVADGRKVQTARRKSFCNQTCNGKFHGLSQVTRQKISQALMGSLHHPRSPEWKSKISKALKGRKGTPLTPERLRNLVESRRRAGTSPETRRKLSLKACANRHQVYNFRHVPFIPHVRLNGKTVMLRGSYELRFATYLDAQGLDWDYATPLAFVDSQGVERHMLPDFFVKGLDSYFDTKGYLSKQCQEKLELVKKQTGIRIHLLFLPDIESLEKGKKVLADFIA